MSYFKRHWPVDLHADVLTCVEDIVSCSVLTGFMLNRLQFKDRYLALQGQLAPKTLSAPAKSKIHTLLRELSDDEDDSSAESGSAVPDDPNRPWLRDFRAYLDTTEHVPDGWSMVKWWGVSTVVQSTYSKACLTNGENRSMRIAIPFGHR